MSRTADRPEPSRRLTDLELEIMQIVWEAEGEPQTVRAVAERLEARGRRLAYTSVQTMLNILKKKGVLSSRPGPGRAHEYQSRLTREQATQSMTQDFVQRLFGGDAQPLLARLLDHESVSRDELEGLKNLIEKELGDEEVSP
jgi:BlaI family penicillinase repressor